MLAPRSNMASTPAGGTHCPLDWTRRRYLFSGRVQGVGFRYTTKNIAMCHDVTGYVRNLPDGRVELVMEGSASEIEAMVNAIRSRMSGYISDVETTSWPATGEFEHFHIRH